MCFPYFLRFRSTNAKKGKARPESHIFFENAPSTESFDTICFVMWARTSMN